MHARYLCDHCIKWVKKDKEKKQRFAEIKESIHFLPKVGVQWTGPSPEAHHLQTKRPLPQTERPLKGVDAG